MSVCVVGKGCLDPGGPKWGFSFGWGRLYLLTNGRSPLPLTVGAVAARNGGNFLGKRLV